MAKRNLYLDIKSVDEAAELYLSALKKTLDIQYETIPVVESLERVTRKATYAKYCSPLFNASAMDGIAVISSRTDEANETNPVILKEEEDYLVVDTGDPIHPPYDAVIMAEDITEVEEGVKIFASAAPWQHVRPIGEDIVAGEMILPSNHKIRPIDVGVLLSAGIIDIEVVKKPEVAIFPTGTEIIEPTETPADGSIIESNSRMFENMVTRAGGIAHRFPPIIDDYEQIRNHVAEAVGRYDMVIINAGSSAGTEDYTVHVLRELGEVLVHGVAIKPGKPVILAMVKGKPVVGLPGYPVSAYIGFENFVDPVLAEMCQTPVRKNPVVQAHVSKRLVSSLKHKEYVRVKVGKVGDKMVAAPLARGAGAAMSLVRADGFCVIEQNSEGVEAGEAVQVQLYREPEEVENTVVVIGSHDLILDVMADMMPESHKGMFVSSTHVGSMGGLMALKRGEAHLAPIHLLDETSGEYNIAYIKKLFGEGKISLIKGVGRTQGILVKKGNPLGIKGIEDLKDCRYVNRQRGAGTRVLFDYKLKQLGIEPSSINGYDREATTHMAVAAAVGSDGADAGMGILSAAKAMDLDFVPIGPEEYDFAIPEQYLNLPHIQAFLEILKSDEFHRRLDELGGYTYEKAGEIVAI
ncbi:molybdopterin biosynthesis protein [Anaerovorax odorimutans]|uniref:Molybdopterin molybdenumtransferase n=1 Tax=Anaerovorax odorimutans TaxID=109327 RepID=A0ABT1RKF0_9FIRM|nr:molybdopterin biosynthesis protein [Anaerovorax odorimutans]MCQ4635656.1 molybdopterin biosynthesis protein [Anaerovorax odorimutans]